MSKLLKSILPVGAVERGGKWEWRKRGGYADASIRATLRKARAAGFVPVDSTSHDTPDGSVVGSGEYYRDPAGNVLYVSSRLGATRADNSFRMEMTPAPEPAAEPLPEPEPVGYVSANQHQRLRAEYYAS
jgi:hypothetical protein